MWKKDLSNRLLRRFFDIDIFIFFRYSIEVFVSFRVCLNEFTCNIGFREFYVYSKDIIETYLL